MSKSPNNHVPTISQPKMRTEGVGQAHSTSGLTSRQALGTPSSITRCIWCHKLSLSNPCKQCRLELFNNEEEVSESKRNNICLSVVFATVAWALIFIVAMAIAGEIK